MNGTPPPLEIVLSLSPAGLQVRGPTHVLQNTLFVLGLLELAKDAVKQLTAKPASGLVIPELHVSPLRKPS